MVLVCTLSGPFIGSPVLPCRARSDLGRAKVGPMHPRAVQAPPTYPQAVPKCCLSVLFRVCSTDVRAFINSCLAPVELRPSVVVLLKDVFLANGSESSTPIPGTAQPTPTTPITSKSLQELQAGLNAPSPEPDVPCSQSGVPWLSLEDLP